MEAGVKLYRRFNVAGVISIQWSCARRIRRVDRPAGRGDILEVSVKYDDRTTQPRWRDVIVQFWKGCCRTRLVHLPMFPLEFFCLAQSCHSRDPRWTLYHRVMSHHQHRHPPVAALGVQRAGADHREENPGEKPRLETCRPRVWLRQNARSLWWVARAPPRVRLVGREGATIRAGLR